MEVEVAALAVSAPLDGRGTEHGAQCSLVAALDRTAGHAIGVDDRHRALPVLVGHTIELVLEHGAQQLPTRAPSSSSNSAWVRAVASSPVSHTQISSSRS
jgi:hypothetical protein